uniref:Uncharacterized protein n=1 Tax=Anguilla anguilla TaxID=7936 RepID=A0A0E9RV55_ANGAN
MSAIYIISSSHANFLFVNVCLDLCPH